MGLFNIPLDIFKTQFEQILQNMPSLKIIQITRSNMTEHVRNYMISNYAEQCLVSFEGRSIFPVKIIYSSMFDELNDHCQFKGCLEYVEVVIDITEDENEKTDWNNFKNNIYDFSQLKCIHFFNAGLHFDEAMKESDFYKPETTGQPSLKAFITFGSIAFIFFKVSWNSNFKF